MTSYFRQFEINSFELTKIELRGVYLLLYLLTRFRKARRAQRDSDRMRKPEYRKVKQL